MKTVLNYLDDLKKKTGSDYASAKALNVTKSAISQMRSRGQIADDTAVNIARLLELEEGEVLFAAAIARSEGEVKQAWIRTSRRGGIAASIGAIMLLNHSVMMEYTNYNNLTPYTLYEVQPMFFFEDVANAGRAGIV
jgi:hypothetical protein